jgi:hypothetical protein
VIDPLQALLQSALKNNQFAPTSRYASIEKATYVRPDGTPVVYLRRRFLPPGDRFTVLLEHTVKDGERLDNIAALYLGDPEQSWRLCDANDAMRPEELTEKPGTTLNITLPEGISGVPNA